MRQKRTFTPHLLPLMRGIVAAGYVRLKGRCSTERLTALYQEWYRAAPFVHVLEKPLPELRFVSGSNACHVGVRYDERTGRATCISAIDNLVKGRRFAIQNMNLVCGLEERGPSPRGDGAVAPASLPGERPVGRGSRKECPPRVGKGAAGTAPPGAPCCLATCAAGSGGGLRAVPGRWTPRYLVEAAGNHAKIQAISRPAARACPVQ